LERVRQLEQRQELAKPTVFQYGWLKPLPKDYVGERHVVIVKREPNKRRQAASGADLKSAPEQPHQTSTIPTLLCTSRSKRLSTEDTPANFVH
jgi:hypothetical protein